MYELKEVRNEFCRTMTLAVKFFKRTHIIGYCSIWKQLLFFLSVRVHPFFLDIQIDIENIFILFSLFCKLYVQAMIQGLQNQCKRNIMFSLKIDIVKDYTSNYFSFLYSHEKLLFKFEI